MSEISASAKAMEKEKPDTTKNAERTGKKAKPSVGASLNMDELRELAELVNEHGFTDFEFENENIRIRLSKTAAPQVIQALPPVSQAPAAQQVAAAATETIPVETPAGAAEEDLYKITSPIVGTFYRSPSPDKAP